MNRNQWSTSDENILGGTPVFAGTRVPVQTLIEYLQAGDSLEDFLEDFLSVDRQQAIGILEYLNELVTAQPK